VDGVESFSLLSLGLDIGTATSHLGLTRLTFRRQGARLSANYAVAERHAVYRSPIVLTPYATPDSIDIDALDSYVTDFLHDADVMSNDIDTGLVVITGEALTKHNSAAISQWFAERIGEFTCVSAGAHHEAVLAAHGSGAVRRSRDTHSRGLCIDIGGGTTKLAVVHAGTIVSTIAVHIGGRLVAFDDDGAIVRVEQPAIALLNEIGVEPQRGAMLSDVARRELTGLMATRLADVVEGKMAPEDFGRLLVTEPSPLPAVSELDWILFSGGVSEYLHGLGDETLGDLGYDLAVALREAFADRGIWSLVVPTSDGIRATMVGAGEYTVQASGMTSYVSDMSYLPVRGLQVIRAAARADDIEALQADIRRQLRRLDRTEIGADVALAIDIDARPRYPYLRSIAEAIVGVASGSADVAPLHIVTDDDVARSLGSIIHQEVGWSAPVVVVDGIRVGELDYLDIGRPVSAVDTMPVTVTSLIFPETTDVPADHQPSRVQAAASA